MEKEESHVHIGVIINPEAGARSAETLIPRLQKLAAHGLARLDIRILDNGGRIEELIHDLQQEADIIAVVGGDGTLNGAVNGILQSSRPNTPLAFIPKGRGNDGARSIPSFLRPDDLRKLFEGQNCRKVDVGRITFPDGSVRRFVNIASMGLSATSVDIASHFPRVLGHYCYLMAAGAGLLRERPFDVRMSIDGGDEITLPGCRMLAVANGRYFGSGLRIAPDAIIDDGLFDVVTVSGISNPGVLRNLPKLRNGTHVHLSCVRQWKATSISINADDRVPIEYDGETGSELPVDIQIEPGAITWIDPS